MRCSTVWIFTSPCTSVEARRASPTSSARAGMSITGSRSTRRNTMPVSGGAGRSVMRTLRPVCKPTPEALMDDLRVRCRSMWITSDDIGDFCCRNHLCCCCNFSPKEGWAAERPGKVERSAAGAVALVSLLAKEGRNVVLVHPRLLQRFDRRSAVAADDRGRIELMIVDRPRQIVGPGLLVRDVAQHELRLGLLRRRSEAQSRRHHGHAQAFGQRVVVHAAVDDGGVVRREGAHDV